MTQGGNHGPAVEAINARLRAIDGYVQEVRVAVWWVTRIDFTVTCGHDFEDVGGHCLLKAGHAGSHMDYGDFESGELGEWSEQAAELMRAATADNTVYPL